MSGHPSSIPSWTENDPVFKPSARELPGNRPSYLTTTQNRNFRLSSNSRPFASREPMGLSVDFPKKSEGNPFSAIHPCTRQKELLETVNQQGKPKMWVFLRKKRDPLLPESPWGSVDFPKRFQSEIPALPSIRDRNNS